MEAALTSSADPQRVTSGGGAAARAGAETLVTPIPPFPGPAPTLGSGLGLGSCHYRLSLVQHLPGLDNLDTLGWIFTILCLLIPQLITRDTTDDKVEA